MSNMAFVVLLPDARRQTVKVTSDTSLLQVLEDACAKRGFNPAEWDLKHINREVDLGKAVRFSGLPNNATLEMVPSTKPRVESPVTVVLQLESGKRLSHQFSPSDNLLSIIEHWASNGESIAPASGELQPVCIYMRQEIMGRENLATRTLRSLGLYKGSALIRLIHRSGSTSAPEQANVSVILRRPSSNQQPITTEGKDVPRRNEFAGGAITASTISETGKPGTVKTAVHSPGKSNNQSVSSSSPPTAARREPQMMSKNTPSAKENQTAVNVNASQPEAETPAVQQPVQVPATGSQQPTRPVELHCQRGDFYILGPNDALVYHADDVGVPEIEALPDDFYDVTVRDIEVMYRSLREKRKELEEAPLQISTSREEERDQHVQTLIESHPTTIVRVRFPDRFVLQGSFRSTDSIDMIYDFVRQYLHNNRQSFYLFTAPPKKILSESSTLVEENLIGYAVIYFGSSSSESPILRDSVQVSDPEKVFHFTPNPGHLLPRSHKVPTTTAPASHVNEAGTSRGSASSGAPKNSAAASRAVNSNVVPKWFKK